MVTLCFGVEVPDAHGVVVAGGEEVVVLGVDHEVGDAVGVPLEHLDHPVLVDRPVEDEVVLLGGHQNGAVVVRVGDLLDLVDFHEQLAVALRSARQEHVQRLRVSHVQDLPIVRKVQPHDVLRVLLYYLGRLHALEHATRQLHCLLALH